MAKKVKIDRDLLEELVQYTYDAYGESFGTRAIEIEKVYLRGKAVLDDSHQKPLFK